jgi:hypothetical protein
VAQLQEDLAAVNNTAGPNTIILAPGTYSLPSQLQVVNAGNLTIRGTTKKGKGTEIVAGPLGRAIEIDGGSVTLSNLTVSGGFTSGSGGGILAQNANLTVTQSSITGNLAMQAGGGIAAQGGTLNVERSTINDNRASSASNTAGGGIAATNATVNITGTAISNNSTLGTNMNPQATAVDTGGGIFTQGGTLSVLRSSITGNKAYAFTTGANASSSAAGISTVNTTATVALSSITTNALSSIAHTNNLLQGTAFSTIGGSLKITNSNISANKPNGPANFFHPNTTVVIAGGTVDGQKINGVFTLRNVATTSNF